jgi:hypothetical protein
MVGTWGQRHRPNISDIFRWFIQRKLRWNGRLNYMLTLFKRFYVLLILQIFHIRFLSCILRTFLIIMCYNGNVKIDEKLSDANHLYTYYVLAIKWGAYSIFLVCRNACVCSALVSPLTRHMYSQRCFLLFLFPVASVF